MSVPKIKLRQMTSYSYYYVRPSMAKFIELMHVEEKREECTSYVLLMYFFMVIVICFS